MAEDIWTINLECDGADVGDKYVQRKMDRDHISFFDLIALIEEHGYKSIDYLYYKRKDRGLRASLVPIIVDTDVTNMINEHEKEKKVYLFVTREKVIEKNSVSISTTESNEQPTKSANKSKGKRGRKRRLNVTQTDAQYADELEQNDDYIQDMPGDNDGGQKRRRTILKHVWDLPEGRKIVVRCNPLGQPIGKEGGLLGQFLGTVARNGGYCPLDLNDRRKVKKDEGDQTIVQFVQTKFFGLLWLEIGSQKKGKVLSEKNKISRGMRKTSHTAGTKSYARWAEDLRQNDPEKRMPHRAKVFLATHKQRAKGTDEHMVQLENIIDEHPELAENNEGKVAWQGDALQQVLGEEKCGQVHGLGLLPVTKKQVYGQTSHRFKDVNVVTMDGSSSDVQTHMLEEIKQLKDHSKKQDQVIEELLNERAQHENREQTMVNTQEMNHDNFQVQTVHSIRKRVQCNLTSQKNLLGAQADEINKERLEAQVKTSNDVEPFLSAQKCYHDTNSKEVSLQEGESSSPPFPANNGGQQEYDMDDGSSYGVQKQNKRMMSKRHYRGFEHTRAMTQKEVARNKPTSHGTSKKFHTRIKDGSVVLLKSAMYPNKDIVAYATILSSSPQAEVDGIKIGKEFYKVRINHAISENEPLVRPLSGYKMLADVSAKRVPIA
ncbi:hypothetical protein QOZ80_5BG0441740 [Eleusine coracana subsp. coracana]|nr:hypothetical protein QOZ80_5BG0441740 [Eleusine coracana subsp. coracana]